MSDVLNKPVHIALLRKTHIKQLEEKGVTKSTPASTSAPTTLVIKNNTIKETHSSITKQAKLQTKLRILYDSVNPLPKDKVPPCDTCVAACCYVFLVDLTEDEYESGLFGDAAIKISPEIAQQLRNKGLLSTTVTVPAVFTSTETNYFLEGRVGDPCPFLVEKRCSIYEDRPYACRVYTCIGDSRITDDMRNGTAPLFPNTEK